jgi:hypothetical protein
VLTEGDRHYPEWADGVIDVAVGPSTAIDTDRRSPGTTAVNPVRPRPMMNS